MSGNEADGDEIADDDVPADDGVNTDGTPTRRTSIGWGLAFLLLAALSIPWFLWGSTATALGLPVWLWWHVAWMAVAAGTFHLFTRRAWGLWVESPAGTGGR